MKPKEVRDNFSILYYLFLTLILIVADFGLLVHILAKMKKFFLDTIFASISLKHHQKDEQKQDWFKDSFGRAF